MKRTILSSLLSVFTLVTYGQQKSQNYYPNELQKIVIKGNRLKIPFSATTKDIQIITQKEIAALPVHSVNELLAYVGGMDIRQRGPFGGQADISMDGGTFEEVLVLLNGIKLLNMQTAHNMMNIPIPLSAIDHIEVLRGAAARKYGINALTGAINIVTKKSAKSFLSANVYAGSSFRKQDLRDGNGIYGGGGIDATGNWGNQKQRHLVSVSKDWYNGQRYNTAQNNTRLFYNGAYHFNDDNAIKALAGYANNHFGANGYYAAPGDSNSIETVRTAIFGLSSEHHIGAFTLSSRISDRYDYDDYRYFKNKPDVGRSQHHTNSLSMEINATLQTSVGTFGLGWESLLSQINSTNIGQHNRNNHGIYGEYQGAFWEKLMANAGVYINYNTDYGWQVYPGFDLAYLINTHWKISANVGSGQRIPSFTDLYLNQPPGNIGNTNLQPENAWQYEADIAYHAPKISLKAGYFYRDILDFIDWVRTDENHPYSPQNFGNNRVHGVYVRLKQNFHIGRHQELGYDMSYNYLHPKLLAKEQKQSKYVLETLKHQFIAGLHYRYKDFSIQLKNRLLKRELGSFYDVMDVRLRYQLESFQIYMDLTNLLDTQYIETGAVPMPSRWFNLGVRWRL